VRKKDIFGLHHIGIYVVDRDESIKFYEEALGFHHDFSFEVEANNGFLKIACVQLEVDGNDVVTNAYRIVPGKKTPPQKRVCICRNLKGLLGLEISEAIRTCGGL
jgi:hypothetical protein